jgi:hypothetical protein
MPGIYGAAVQMSGQNFIFAAFTTPVGRILALSTSPQISLALYFSGVLRAKRANVSRFQSRFGIGTAVSAALDKPAMRRAPHIRPQGFDGSSCIH